MNSNVRIRVGVLSPPGNALPTQVVLAVDDRMMMFDPDDAVEIAHSILAGAQAAQALRDADKILAEADRSPLPPVDEEPWPDGYGPYDFIVDPDGTIRQNPNRSD